MNVRISTLYHNILRELAEQENSSMQGVLEKAVEQYRRKWFLEEANTAYAKLRANPDAWAEELEERKLWENTLMDGLEEE